MVVIMPDERALRDLVLSRYVPERTPLDQGLVDLNAALVAAYGALPRHLDPPQAPKVILVTRPKTNRSSMIRKTFSKTAIFGS